MLRPNPLPIETLAAPTSSTRAQRALPVLTDRAKDFIATRLARREPPERIAAALRALFQIEIDPARVIPCFKGEITLPTQTGRRQDEESMQFPADEVKESLVTRMADVEAPHVMSGAAMPRVASEPAAQTPASLARDPDQVPDGAGGDDAPATQTGRRRNGESLQIPADPVDEPAAHDDPLETLGMLVKAKLGIAPAPAPATQTGRRQNQKKSVLTDEMKEFIVRGLARYETPTRVAASVKAQFGIEIDRRQVYAYDPAGSRPPAQRWIDLHAATREKFTRAVAEIGVAQKVVRLRMLDRLAHRCERNSVALALACLREAAKECGGFYERHARPKAAPAPAAA